MNKLKLGLLSGLLFAGLLVPLWVHWHSGSGTPGPGVTNDGVSAESPLFSNEGTLNEQGVGSGSAEGVVTSARQSKVQKVRPRSVASGSAVAPRIQTAAGTVQADPSFRINDDFIKGRRLTEKEAEELEARLAQDPTDLSARRQLLAYYSGAAFRSAAMRQARQGQILWWIENHPELAPRAYTSLDPMLDGPAYARARDLWLEQTKNQSQNAAVLANAAGLFLLPERGTAESLLKQAQGLEPTNPAYYEQMAQLYALDRQSPDPAVSKDAAAKALQQMELAQANTVGDGLGSYNYINLAQYAIDAGDLSKARTYASGLLERDSQAPTGSKNDGDSIFRGNVVLGRVALREGNVEAAKQYLLAAGETTGSPVLDSFGPNMALAKELLERGETATVLDYFQRCARFWKSDKLNIWTRDVKQGAMPDFGANLVH